MSFGRNGGDRRDGSEQHNDHRDDAGACGGAVTVAVTLTRRAGLERTGIRTRDGRGSIAFVQVEVGPATIQTSTATVAVSLSGSADGGGFEHRGGGMGRHHVDGQVGDGQQGEHLHPGDGADERDRIEAVDLLRQEHRRGQQHGDGDVQPGGGVSGCADPGVQRAGYERAAGCDGGGGGEGTAASSGAATTTAASELIFGAGTNGATFTGSGDRIHRADHQTVGNIAEDKTVRGTGSNSATAPTAPATG